MVPLGVCLHRDGEELALRVTPSLVLVIPANAGIQRRWRARTLDSGACPGPDPGTGLRGALGGVGKSALMKPLRSRAVEQSTLSSPLRMAIRIACLPVEKRPVDGLR